MSTTIEDALERIADEIVSLKDVHTEVLQTLQTLTNIHSELLQTVQTLTQETGNIRADLNKISSCVQITHNECTSGPQFMIAASSCDEENSTYRAILINSLESMGQETIERIKKIKDNLPSSDPFL